MTKLVLIRGLPGSGKSTMAKTVYSDYAHFEADMYFVTDSKYEFKREKIGDAHAWCQHRVNKSLVYGFSTVVTNTFVRRWELEPYIKIANELNVDVEIITANGNYPNIHGVSKEIIDRMRVNWEDYDLSKKL